MALEVSKVADVLNEEIGKRLIPFGFSIRVRPDYERVMVIAEKVIRAAGHWWDGQKIGYHGSIDQRYLMMSRDAHATIENFVMVFCTDCILEAMRMVAKVPQAPELDWRPNETIPEDFYAM